MTAINELLTRLLLDREKQIETFFYKKIFERFGELDMSEKGECFLTATRLLMGKTEYNLFLIKDLKTKQDLQKYELIGSLQIEDYNYEI